jgi:hydroxymethylbilane synthase
MMSMEEITTLRFGTRGSALALWQTEHAAGLLRSAHPGLRVEVVVIQTHGDQVLDTPLPLIGGKGLFTAELEAALRDGRIDCAVHSLKDLPTEPPDGLVIGAIPARADPADVLISRDRHTLSTLPAGARVGTSSTRRAAQLLAQRPDLMPRDIRGNVDTRLRKALAANHDGAQEYDAIILARAGLERLGQLDAISETLDLAIMLPAPGQGAIAVQTRPEPALLRALAAIHHTETALAVTAERAFLAALGGGCSLPVAAYAVRDGDDFVLRGRVCSPDGARQIDVNAAAALNSDDDAEALGRALAADALSRGARDLLPEARP